MMPGLLFGRTVNPVAGLAGQAEGRDAVAAGGQLNLPGAGAFHGDRSGGGGDVFQFHLVGDDVALDVLLDFLAQLGFGIDQEVIGQAEELDIGLDAPLRAKQESVVAHPRGHLLHFIARNVVQQPRTVAAACDNAAARGEIHPCRTVAQRFITLGHAFSLEDVRRFKIYGAARPKVTRSPVPRS